MVTATLSRLVNYGIILLAGFLLFFPSMFLPPLNPSTPLLSACNYTMFCSSSRTPWGVVTSLFMFDRWNNIGLFVNVAIIFLFSNYVYSPSETRRRCLFALASMFASGIIPNILLLAIRPTEEVYGPSGVVYGFIGTVVGLSVFNIFPARWEGLDLRGLKAYYSVLRNIALTTLNVLVLVVLIAFLVGNPSQFLSVGPNVNVLGHPVGLIIGFASVYLYRHYTYKKW